MTLNGVVTVILRYFSEFAYLPGHIVQNGDPPPLPKKGAEPPIFGPFLLCQTAGYIKMSLGTEVDLSPDDFVLDGDRAPSLKRGGAPQFSAHVYYRQTAAWIKMPLGMKVCLSLRDDYATLC